MQIKLYSSKHLTLITMYLMLFTAAIPCILHLECWIWNFVFRISNISVDVNDTLRDFNNAPTNWAISTFSEERAY